MKKHIIIGSYDVSPDGERVAFTVRFENRRNQQYLSEIYITCVKDKLKTRLTDNRAPESNVLFAPDAIYGTRPMELFPRGKVISIHRAEL